MKSILILSFMLFTINCIGQIGAKTKDVAISNAEKFTEKSGTLLQKEFIEIGYIGERNPCKIQVAIYTDLISKTSIKAVRLEYNYPGDNEAKLGLIDVDELDGALKSIKILKENTFITSPDNYTEVYFTSRSGFCVGGYFSNKQWTPFMEIKSGGYHSFVSLDTNDFGKLYTVFQQAKAKL